MPADPNDITHWQFDKRIPLALIVVLLAQGGTGVWWASNMSLRMNEIERKTTSLTANNSVLQNELMTQARNNAVMLEQISNTNQNISRLESELRDTNGLLRELLTNRYNGVLP